MNNIPVFNINIPGGGSQQRVFIDENTPVYSSYTGQLVGYGPIQRNQIMTDAPRGHPRHGQYFHVIEFNPVNGSHMVHHNCNSYPNPYNRWR